jgi:hypothetical protein
MTEKNLRMKKFEKTIKNDKKIAIKKTSIKFKRLKNYRG